MFFWFVKKTFTFLTCFGLCFILNIKSNKTYSLDENSNVTKKVQKPRKIGSRKKNIKSTHKQSKQSNTIELNDEKVINPDSPLCKFAEKNDVINLKNVLSRHKDDDIVNTLCKNEESLLFIAVKNDNFLATKFLLEKGANPNLPNLAGATPLHIVCRTGKPNADKIFKLY